MSRAAAWVVTIGDEVMRGEIVDSNKSFFSAQLLLLDLETARHVSVSDDPKAIAEVLREGAQRARFLLISGGLGPTRDDITTQVVAQTFDRPLRRDAATLEALRAYFASVGRTMTEGNAKQANFPEGAEILANPLGTAPGFALDVDGCTLLCAPGVPRELYRMMADEIMPRMRARLAGDGVVRAALLRTFGIGESALDHMLSDIGAGDDGVKLGFRTQFPDNLVRVVARAPDAESAEQRVRATLDRIRERLGPAVVCEGETPLEQIVGSLLIEHGRTLAVAESCTGGLIAHLLTEVPGSSAYMLAGVVCYANESKVRDLGVQPDALDRHGAVSESAVRQMARGVRERSGADLGLATTGIAGPGGGSDEKPVGTLWVGLATAAGVEARRYHMTRDRSRNKRLAAQIALEWVRRTLLDIPLPEGPFPRLGERPR
jgi:nicotinamide-nucleotide amidase